MHTSTPSTVEILLREGAATLASAGIEAPARDARLLLLHAIGQPRTVLLDRSALVEPNLFHALLARRAAREPLALITGVQGFWTLDLEVSTATLIPRGDSETVIEAALAARPERADVRRILDLGTGTGALLLAALVEFRHAFGVGVDRVTDAARLAARNAERNALAPRCAFLVADWATPLAGRFDLVVSNPPYIESGIIPTLAPEVAQHEPASALDGGHDGLDAYHALLPELPSLLAPGGVAVLELGFGQVSSVSALAHRLGFATEMRPDLTGIPRALVLR